MSLLCDSLLSGYLLPVSFNDSLIVFVPKGTEQDDETGIVRDPFDTRPLALKNSDNKAIGGVVNFLLKRTMARSACALQRGFIPGRQLLENVLNLDTHARAQGMRDGGCRIPILAFWDYAAAFPSVAHAWLFRALASAGAPDGLLSLARGMYNSNWVFLLRREGLLALLYYWGRPTGMPPLGHALRLCYRSCPQEV